MTREGSDSQIGPSLTSTTPTDSQQQPAVVGSYPHIASFLVKAKADFDDPRISKSQYDAVVYMGAAYIFLECLQRVNELYPNRHPEENRLASGAVYQPASQQWILGAVTSHLQEPLPKTQAFTWPHFLYTMRNLVVAARRNPGQSHALVQELEGLLVSFPRSPLSGYKGKAHYTYEHPWPANYSDDGSLIGSNNFLDVPLVLAPAGNAGSQTPRQGQGLGDLTFSATVTNYPGLINTLQDCTLRTIASASYACPSMPLTQKVERIRVGANAYANGAREGHARLHVILAEMVFEAVKWDQISSWQFYSDVISVANSDITLTSLLKQSTYVSQGGNVDASRFTFLFNGLCQQNLHHPAVPADWVYRGFELPISHLLMLYTVISGQRALKFGSPTPLENFGPVPHVTSTQANTSERTTTSPNSGPTSPNPDLTLTESASRFPPPTIAAAVSVKRICSATLDLQATRPQATKTDKWGISLVPLSTKVGSSDGPSGHSSNHTINSPSSTSSLGASGGTALAATTPLGSASAMNGHPGLKTDQEGERSAIPVNPSNLNEGQPDSGSPDLPEDTAATPSSVFSGLESPQSQAIGLGIDGIPGPEIANPSVEDFMNLEQLWTDTRRQIEDATKASFDELVLLGYVLNGASWQGAEHLLQLKTEMLDDILLASLRILLCDDPPLDSRQHESPAQSINQARTTVPAGDVFGPHDHDGDTKTTGGNLSESLGSSPISAALPSSPLAALVASRKRYPSGPMPITPSMSWPLLKQLKSAEYSSESSGSSSEKATALESTPEAE